MALNPKYDPPIPLLPSARGSRGVLDYTIIQTPEGTYMATLNVRAIAGEGSTEHEAIVRLLNYVAELCSRGLLDETGVPASDIVRSDNPLPSAEGPKDVE